MAITEQDLELPASPASVREARHFVVGALEALGAGRQREVAALLTSELVTNAIVHAGGAVRVRIRNDTNVVRVAVRDSSVTPPTPRTSGDRAVTGRGLGLVEKLASRWGTDVSSDGSGKEVWFELRF